MANTSQQSFEQPDNNKPDPRVNEPTRIGEAAHAVSKATTFSDYDEQLQEMKRSPVIGPYKLLQRIGQGGMGLVFMAEQDRPVRRRVALKLIKAGMDSKEIITRFEAERQALAMMDHANIARVLDAGTTVDGLPYFVMELVNGIQITEYCDKHKLSLDHRLQLFMQSCKAIQHAHQKGIIHRDIKPSNVLVTEQDGLPVVKVIDFGLAKALQTTNRLTEKTMFTEFGQVVGTLQYMSPEQAEMNPLDIDTRSDVYSLGVLLYELLTGSTPIEKQSLKVMALDRVLLAIRELEPPRPSHRLSSLGDSATGISEQRRTDPRRLGLILKGDLDWITMKALEKDRTRRYDSPVQMAEDVQRYLTSEAVIARPPSLTYRLRKSIRKHRAAFLTTAIMFALLLLGMAATTWQMFRARKAELESSDQHTKTIAQARIATEEARKSKAAEKRASEEKAKSIVLADIARDESVRARAAEQKALEEEANSATQAAIARDEASKARSAEQKAKEAEAKAKAQAVLASTAEEKAREQRDQAIEAKKKTEMTLARSHYHLAIARWDENRIAEAIELLDKIPRDYRHFEWYLARSEFEGSDVTFFGHVSTVTCVAFSTDGTRLVSSSQDGSIRVWNAATGEELSSIKEIMSGTPFTLSPDGIRIVAGSADYSIKQWNLLTGEELIGFKGHSDELKSVSFSPDGTRLVSSGRDKSIRLWDAATAQELWSIPDAAPTRLTFSPDGSRLAGRRNETIIILEAATGTELQTITAPYYYEGDALSFSPDGTLIASGSSFNQITVWDTKTGTELRTLKGHTDTVQSVSFSPDGMRIASGSSDNTIRLWDVFAGTELRTLKGHTDTVQSVSFSPDGMRIASGSSDSTIKLWDSATIDEVKTIRTGHEGGVYGAALNPNGTRIVTAGFDGSIKISDTITGEELLTLKGSHPYGEVSYSADGTQIASGGSESINLWNAETGDKLRTLYGSFRVSGSVSFSPDGTRIASGCDDDMIRIWNVASGDEVMTFRGIKGNILGVLFSPDGERLAAVTRSTIRLLNATTGVEQCSFEGLSPRCVAFSPDGARIAVGGSNQTITVLDVVTENVLQRFRAHANIVECIAYSPDGMRIASGSADNTVRLWDGETGEELRTLNGHSKGVTNVLFSSDSEMLVSGSWDNTIRLWRAATTDELKILDGHVDSVVNFKFSRNSKKLLSVDLELGSTVHDVATGLSVSVNHREFDDPGRPDYSNISPDGRWLAIPMNRRIGLVDLYVQQAPFEKKRRERLARSRPDRHQQQADSCEKRRNLYAAVFHRACLVVHNPADPTAADLFLAAHQKWHDVNRSNQLPVSPVVTQALVIANARIPR